MEKFFSIDPDNDEEDKVVEKLTAENVGFKTQEGEDDIFEGDYGNTDFVSSQITPKYEQVYNKLQNNIWVRDKELDMALKEITKQIGKDPKYRDPDYIFDRDEKIKEFNRRLILLREQTENLPKRTWMYASTSEMGLKELEKNDPIRPLLLDIERISFWILNPNFAEQLYNAEYPDELYEEAERRGYIIKMWDSPLRKIKSKLDKIESFGEEFPEYSRLINAFKVYLKLIYEQSVSERELDKAIYDMENITGLKDMPIQDPESAVNPGGGVRIGVGVTGLKEHQRNINRYHMLKPFNTLPKKIEALDLHFNWLHGGGLTEKNEDFTEHFVDNEVGEDLINILGLLRTDRDFYETDKEHFTEIMED